MTLLYSLLTNFYATYKKIIIWKFKTLYLQPSADVKPVGNDLVHAMQSMLSLSLYAYTLISMVMTKYCVTKSTGSIMLMNFGKRIRLKASSVLP